MKPERFELLAAVIAAYTDGKVPGRTRLQKTVRLLQRLGFPTDYGYMLHFYGPYSEGLQAEIGLLVRLGLVKETCGETQDGRPYYVIEATEQSHLPQIDEKYRRGIRVMAKADPVVLELAATYDAFIDMGMEGNEALEALRRKKGTKCDDGNDVRALDLLKELGLKGD